VPHTPVFACAGLESPSRNNYRWTVEGSRPREKILASAFEVHAPASALPIASMIPTLARKPDLATRTSPNSDPDAKPIPRLNAFTMIQLLQFAACRRSTVHCARSKRHVPNPFNSQPLIYHLTNSRSYGIL